MRKPDGLDGAERYRLYLIFLLATLLTLNGIDGTAIGLVLPSIKHDLRLADTQLGLLTGIAFSLFYSTVGVRIGRWADRGDRVAILAVTCALWGVMVMMVGAVRSFAQLLIVRVGVAVGEAGCFPAAYSLIGDYFERNERPRAIANFLLGSSASIMVGYSMAGWLSYHYGWRRMFVCIGSASVVVAPIVWWTLSEPRRRRERRAIVSAPEGAAGNMMQVIPVLWRNRTFRALLGVQSLNWFFGLGIYVWVPSFFARSFGLGIEQIGFALSLVYGVGGLIGTYVGGYLASRYAAGNERLQLRVSAIFNVGYGALSAVIYLSKDAAVSLPLLALAVAVGAVQGGPLFGTAQTVVPERLRAVSVSVMYLVSNLVGGGLGPLLVGALSDAFHPYVGAESLRYALVAMCPGFLAGCWLYWRAARTVVADVEAAVGTARESSGLRCAQT